MWSLVRKVGGGPRQDPALVLPQPTLHCSAASQVSTLLISNSYPPLSATLPSKSWRQVRIILNTMLWPSSSPNITCPATQFEVAQPPNDAISAVVFAPDAPRRLLVSSWDKNLYLYEVAEGGEEASLVKTYEHRAPVLDVCFGANQDEAFTAGMDRQVKRSAVYLAPRRAANC